MNQKVRWHRNDPSGSVPPSPTRSNIASGRLYMEEVEQSGEDIDATVCTTWPEGRRPIESSIAVSGCARDRLPGIDQHGETGLAGPMAARGRAVHRILEHL
jgi:hypothetical protein